MVLTWRRHIHVLSVYRYEGILTYVYIIFFRNIFDVWKTMFVDEYNNNCAIYLLTCIEISRCTFVASIVESFISRRFSKYTVCSKAIIIDIWGGSMDDTLVEKGEFCRNRFWWYLDLFETEERHMYVRQPLYYFLLKWRTFLILFFSYT